MSDTELEKTYCILSRRPPSKIDIPVAPDIEMKLELNFPGITSEEEWDAVIYVSKNKEQYSKYVDSRAELYAKEIDSLDAGKKESNEKMLKYVNEVSAAGNCLVSAEQEKRISDLGYVVEDLPIGDGLGLPAGTGVLRVVALMNESPGGKKLSEAVMAYSGKAAQKQAARSGPPPEMYS